MAEVVWEAMDACKVRGPSSDDMRHMYLDLLKRALCNLIYPENELRIMYAQARAAAKQPVDVNLLMDIRNRLKEKFRELYECRRDGRRTVSQYSHSMIGLKRMDNIQVCAENIFEDAVPGDFVETGVWRGGAVIFMRAPLKVYGQENRLVWAADSFCGLPPPELDQDAGYDFSKNRTLAIDLETVMNNFRTYDLLDDKVKFLEGWFEDTLPNAPIEKVALLRLDADLYKSTMDAMESLYDKVAVGGYVIVDDYGDLEPCRQEIDEFRDRRGITDPMIPVDWTGVYWRKGGEVNGSSATEEQVDLNQQGEALFHHGRIEEALALFMKLVTIKPHEVTAHNNLGVLYWHIGQVQKALECFTKAYKIDPDYRVTVLNLIEVLKMLNQLDEAKLIGMTHLERHPGDQEIVRYLEKG